MWHVVVLLEVVVPGNALQVLDSWRVQLAKASLKDIEWRRAVERSTKTIPIKGDPEAVATILRARELATAVLDEEEYRATQIVVRGGAPQRPRDAPPDVRGPLGNLEARFVDVVEGNVFATVARWVREALDRISVELAAIAESERVRVKLRTRPMDAPPSALGRLEQFFDSLVKEETRREGRRPLEAPAASRGPLASIERQVAYFFDALCSYETKRLAKLRDDGLVQRPMDRQPQGALGLVEQTTVGVLRAPLLVGAVIARIQEIINEDALPPDDLRDNDAKRVAWTDDDADDRRLPSNHQR